MIQIKLALSSEQASKLAHRELAIVRDLPRTQTPGPSSRHIEALADIVMFYVASCKLYIRTDRVTDKGSQH